MHLISSFLCTKRFLRCDICRIYTVHTILSKNICLMKWWVIVWAPTAVVAVGIVANNPKSASTRLPLAPFVPEKDLVNICRKIIQDASGLPSSIEAVCLNEMKAAMDGLTSSNLIENPQQGMASKLLDQCENFHQFVTADGSFLVSPSQCGILAMKRSSELGLPLVHFVPEQVLDEACAKAVSRGNCEMEYKKALEDDLGIRGLTTPLCEELRAAPRQKPASARSFCMFRKTSVDTVGEDVPVKIEKETTEVKSLWDQTRKQGGKEKETYVLEPVGESTFGDRHWTSGMNAQAPFGDDHGSQAQGTSMWRS